MADNNTGPAESGEPPKQGAGKRILFVEDDRLVARIYGQKLIEEGFEVALAEDGLEALKQLPGFKPELMVLDLMMPKMTGTDVLRFMRQRPDWNSIRSIVFTNSFVSNLIDPVADLKVEAVLVKAAVTPALLIEKIYEVLANPQTGPSVAQSWPEVMEPQPTLAAKIEAKPAAAQAESDSEFVERMRGQFLERTPELFNELRGLCREFLAATDLATQTNRLAALNKKLGLLTQISSMAGYRRTAELASALDALVFELATEPAHLNDSARQTIASTIALLARSFDSPTLPKERDRPRTEILVVDDDALSIRAVMDALGRARLPSTGAADSADALKHLRRTAFDLVLLDINLPGMDGTELCEAMRKLPLNKRTPAIFVTSFVDFPTRARTILSGGDDLIAKPISPTELCVKVLAHLLRAG